MLTLMATGEAQQQAVGAALARCAPPRLVVYLDGDLGAGKTTLVRGLLRELGHRGAVRSPTYTLMEPYEVAGRRLCHFDLYRLGDPGELEYLGLRDLLDEDRLLLFEWSERGAGELPPADLRIRIGHDGAQRRRLTFEPAGPVGEQLLAALSSELQSFVK